eukprot:3620187-Rhodomonas_salina.1
MVLDMDVQEQHFDHPPEMVERICTRAEARELKTVDKQLEQQKAQLESQCFDEAMEGDFQPEQMLELPPDNQRVHCPSLRCSSLPPCSPWSTLSLRASPSPSPQCGSLFPFSPGCVCVCVGCVEAVFVVCVCVLDFACAMYEDCHTQDGAMGIVEPRSVAIHRQAVINAVQALSEYLGVRRALAPHSFPLDDTSPHDPSGSAGS